jgi:hypothetical protein
MVRAGGTGGGCLSGLGLAFGEAGPSSGRSDGSRKIELRFVSRRRGGGGGAGDFFGVLDAGDAEACDSGAFSSTIGADLPEVVPKYLERS